MEARLVERARIVWGCLEGKPVSAVADSLNVRPNTVIDWRRRFEAEGIAGLHYWGCVVAESICWR